MSNDTCPTCGATVEVHHGLEGTSHYRPVEHELQAALQAESTCDLCGYPKGDCVCTTQEDIERSTHTAERARELRERGKTTAPLFPPPSPVRVKGNPMTEEWALRSSLDAAVYEADQHAEALVACRTDLRAAEARARKAEEALREIASWEWDESQIKVDDPACDLPGIARSALATIRGDQG